MTKSKHSPENARRRNVDGIIRQVDVINRDLTVLVGGIRELIDVPADCSVVLNGETVKLRLLQPGDPVRVTYGYRDNIRTAQRIEAGIARPSDEQTSGRQNT